MTAPIWRGDVEMRPPVRFNVDEAQAAADIWGMNCGPGAIAAVRFSNARDPSHGDGVHDPGGGANYLFIYDDGSPVRMLSNREIRALLVDVHDDWHVSNQ